MLNNKAFTVLELLVVLIIMGIVAAIAIPIIGGVLDDVEQSAMDQEVNNIERAAEMYVIHHGYPTPVNNDVGELTHLDLVNYIESNYNFVIRYVANEIIYIHLTDDDGVTHEYTFN